MLTHVTASSTGMVPVMSAPPHLRNVGATRGLGIASIVLGTVTLCVGIAVSIVNSTYWATKSGAAIWCGAWLIVTGAFGVSSAKFPANGILNGFNMACNIIATFITFIDGIFFAVALGFYNGCTDWFYNPSYTYPCYKTTYYYSYFTGSVTSETQLSYCRGVNSANECDRRSAGLGLYSVLLICMVAEWFVALMAAIYCCSSCCCHQHISGIIIQQPRQANAPVILSTASGHMVSGGSTDYGYPMQPMSYSQSAPPMHPTHGVYTVYEQPRVIPGYGHLASQNHYPTQAYEGVPYASDGSKQDMPPPYS